MLLTFAPVRSQRFALHFAILTAVVLLMPLWVEWIGGYLGLATKIVIFALFAIGFDLLLGFTGYLSFGHAMFFGVGAFGAALWFRDVNLQVLPAILVGTASAAILALALGFIIMRRSGIYFSVLTLAFGEMMHQLAYNSLEPITGGENGIQISESRYLFGLKLHDYSMFYFAAIFMLGFYFLARVIINSPFGLMMRGIKANQNRLEYSGVHVLNYKVGSFMLSAIYAGVAGALVATHDGTASAETLHWTESGHVVVITILGGVGTLIGPFIGAGVIKYFENVVSGIQFWDLGERWNLFLGFIFMMVLLFLPGGLMEAGKRLQAYWLDERSSFGDKVKGLLRSKRTGPQSQSGTSASLSESQEREGA